MLRVPDSGLRTSPFEPLFNPIHYTRCGVEWDQRAISSGPVIFASASVALTVNCTRQGCVMRLGKRPPAELRGRVEDTAQKFRTPVLAAPAPASSARKCFTAATMDQNPQTARTHDHRQSKGIAFGSRVFEAGCRIRGWPHSGQNGKNSFLSRPIFSNTVPFVPPKSGHFARFKAECPLS